MLPSDVDHGAPRVKAFNRNRAVEAQQDAVDLLKEVVRKMDPWPIILDFGV